MALIKLTASELEGVQSQISKISSKASDCANKVSSVRNSLDMEVSSRHNIEERLDNIKRDLTKYSDSLKSYANVLNDVINEFVRTDSSVNSLEWPNWALPIGIAAGAVVGGIGIEGINIPVHTGEMCNWQTQQQLEKIRNATNIYADSSLEKEDTGFWGSIWNKGKEAVEKIGDKAKEAYGNVVQATKDCVSWVKDNYENKGITYTVAQYAKAFGKVAVGGAMLAATVATAGTMAGITGVYGVDSLTNGIVDISKITYNVSQGETAEIEETQLLKDGMEFVVGGAGGAIGEAWGNAELGEEIGEKIASIAYDGGKIVSSIYSISTGWDKIQQARDFNLSGMSGEAKTAVKDYYELFTKVEFNSLNPVKLFGDIKYHAALIGYETPHITNAISNFSLIGDLSKDIIADPVDVVRDLISGNDIEVGGVVGKAKDLFKENFK